jgi:hypothetical protein
MKGVKQPRRALAVEITLDQIDASRGGRGLETETWMHDLRDGRERKATEEESKVYSPAGKRSKRKTILRRGN